MGPACCGVFDLGKFLPFIVAKRKKLPTSKCGGEEGAGGCPSLARCLPPLPLLIIFPLKLFLLAPRSSRKAQIWQFGDTVSDWGSVISGECSWDAPGCGAGNDQTGIMLWQCQHQGSKSY